MSIIVTEMTYGQRIQADGEIEIVEKAEWERLNSAMAELEAQLKGTLDLIRNAHKYGFVSTDGVLDYVKFVIYDSVNKGISLEDTKARVYESEPGKDTGAITLEYNRYTVKRAVTTGWSDQKIHAYLKSMGSSIDIGVVGKRGQA